MLELAFIEIMTKYGYKGSVLIDMRNIADYDLSPDTRYSLQCAIEYSEGETDNFVYTVRRVDGLINLHVAQKKG